MRFFGLALLLICCSFTKSNTLSNASNIEHNEVSSFKKNITSSVESVFSYAIQVSEITISQSGSNVFTSSYEESNVKPFATNKSQEQFIEFRFSQYIHTEKNFLSLSRKSELIFPFHYHW